MMISCSLSPELLSGPTLLSQWRHPFCMGRAPPTRPAVPTAIRPTGLEAGRRLRAALLGFLHLNASPTITEVILDTHRVRACMWIRVGHAWRRA